MEEGPALATARVCVLLALRCPVASRRLRGLAQSASSSRPRAAGRPRRVTGPLGRRQVRVLESADVET